MGVLNARVSGAWVPISAGQSNVDHWNTAWGVVAKANLLGDTVALTTAPINVTGPMTVTLMVGRRYAVNFSVRAADCSAPTTSVVLVDLAVNGTGAYMGDHYMNTLASSVYGGGYNVRWVLDGDGSTSVLTVRGRTTAGTGNVHGQVGPAAFATVEDIGPVTRLAPSATPPDSDWTAWDARYLNTTEGTGANWTPTLTNWSLGNGSVFGRYIQLGKLVQMMGSVTFGSSSTFTGGAVAISLPVTAHASWLGLRTCINCQVIPGGAVFAGRGVIGSATAFNILTQGISGTRLADVAFVQQSEPATWTASSASGFSFSGSYEAA